MRSYSYGMEIELASIDRRTSLPPTMSYSSTELDIVSHEYGAIDPSGKTHTIGGEVNSQPTDTIEGQVAIFEEMLAVFPEAKVNHRHHTHLHIAYPGLATNLVDQKKLLKYFYENTKAIVDRVFNPTKHYFMNQSAWSYQIVDRDTLTPWRYELCMNADTCEDFFASHAKVKDGRVLYQTMKRMAINLYSIKKHGTIELRCLFPTLDPDKIRSSFEFLRDLVDQALSDNPKPVWEALNFNDYSFPEECPYDHGLEMLWQQTNKKK